MSKDKIKSSELSSYIQPMIFLYQDWVLRHRMKNLVKEIYLEKIITCSYIFLTCVVLVRIFHLSVASCVRKHTPYLSAYDHILLLSLKILSKAPMFSVFSIAPIKPHQVSRHTGGTTSCGPPAHSISLILVPK